MFLLKVTECSYWKSPNVPTESHWMAVHLKCASMFLLKKVYKECLYIAKNVSTGCPWMFLQNSCLLPLVLKSDHMNFSNGSAWSWAMKPIDYADGLTCYQKNLIIWPRRLKEGKEKTRWEKWLKRPPHFAGYLSLENYVLKIISFRLENSTSIFNFLLGEK